jgi:gluconolactonase
MTAGVPSQAHETELAYDVVAAGLQFPEGPVAVADGSVLVVEMARGTLSRVRPTGEIEVVAECGGGPNGAAVGADGAIYVTNNGGAFELHRIGDWIIPGDVPDTWPGHGALQRVDPATGEVTDLYTHCGDRPLLAPNDLVVDAEGGLWFTDHGVRSARETRRGGVFWATPDGSTIREVITPLDSPNGIGLSPDGTRLYVAETHTGRLWTWEIVGPGEVAPGLPIHAGGTLHYGAAGLRLFDSLAVDAEGWVNVATLGDGGISSISPDGATLEFRAIPDDPVVTNICLGGLEHPGAWITSSATGRLLRAAWPRAALVPPAFVAG